MDLDEIKVDVVSDRFNNFNEVKPSLVKSASDTKLLKQTDLCNCPLRCNEKVTPKVRDYLFCQFNSLQRHSLQNKYLQKYIVIRSVAKRLWEDEIIDGKMQRRVTCKYQVPNLEDKFTERDISTSENVTSISGLRSENDGKDDKNSAEPGQSNSIESKSPTLNGYDDGSDLSTDMSSSDSEDEDFMHPGTSTANQKPITTLKNMEICQKAFINIYRITEKRIRYLRERLIMKSRYFAEKKQKKIEETERILSIAHNLGAGCQPLIAVLEKTNSLHLSNQILAAIENDVILLNNFFRHQLWKPEYITTTSNSENSKADDQSNITKSLLQRLERVPKLS